MTPQLPMWVEARRAYTVTRDSVEFPHDLREPYELAVVDFKGYEVTPYEKLSGDVKVALEFLMHYACNGDLMTDQEIYEIPDEVAQQYWDFVAAELGLPTGPEALFKAEWQLRGN